MNLQRMGPLLHLKIQLLNKLDAKITGEVPTMTGLHQCKDMTMHKIYLYFWHEGKSKPYKRGERVLQDNLRSFVAIGYNHYCFCCIVNLLKVSQEEHLTFGQVFLQLCS